MKSTDYEKKPSDFSPLSKWTITMQVIEDLGDLDQTLTNKAYSFGLLYNSNRSINYMDIQNLQQALACMEQIYRKVHVFSKDKDFGQRIKRIRDDLKNNISLRPIKIPETFLDQFNNLLNDFYTWWQGTNTYYFSEITSNAKKRLF